MTAEEKKILLKDLCARLPYDLKVQVCNIKEYAPILKGVFGEFIMVQFPYTKPVDFGSSPYSIKDDSVKPYLRPMSSITKEEEKIFEKCFYSDGRMDKDYIRGELLHWNFEDYYPSFEMELCSIPNAIDWLNEHHFDYRGLIEKGLALEAPKDMYETKEG